MRQGDLTVRQLASLGGKARAKSLSAERRREIAIKAINARWGKTSRESNNVVCFAQVPAQVKPPDQEV